MSLMMEQEKMSAMTYQSLSFGISKADIQVLPLSQLDSNVGFALIQSLSSRVGSELLNLLHEQPEIGEKKLEELASEIEIEIEKANQLQAQGICYLIQGATPEQFSPMEYGGLILERDRAILSKVSEQETVVFVNDLVEPYLDFLSDLPCTVFGYWKESGQSLEEMKVMRTGLIASDHEGADIRVEFKDLSGGMN